MTLNIGSLLQGGKYRIEKVLGQGSFGITYLAEHTALCRKVAIKEFFMKELNSRADDGSITGMSESSLSFNYSQKFRKEAQNLSRMDHPNIVRVTDSFEENGTFYYVMDYIEGENLNEYVKKNPLSEEQALSIIGDVAGALTYMHEKHHMLHLDLKPGNIMRRSSDGHIFLIDFGLSKHFSDSGMPETSTSIGLGTAGYAPIEQSNQSKNGEFRPTVDVYALGATLYKLLTGETPPSASDVMNEGLPVERLQAKGISANTIAVVEKAMAPAMRNRYQNVSQLVQAFQKAEEATDAQEATLIDVGPAPIPSSSPKPSQTPAPKPTPEPSSSPSPYVQRKPFIIAGVVVLIGICLYFVFFGGNGQKQDEANVIYADTTLSDNKVTTQPVAPKNPEKTKIMNNESNGNNGNNVNNDNKNKEKERPQKEVKSSDIKNKTATTADAKKTPNEAAATTPTVVITGSTEPIEEAVDDNRIFDVVEEYAQFPGGDAACMDWLRNHVRYPSACQEQGIQGRVIVSFIVNGDGSIVEAKVMRSPDQHLSEEALRVVNSMPKWIPARVGGKPVRSRFNLPVMFRLG